MHRVRCSLSQQEDRSGCRLPTVGHAASAVAYVVDIVGLRTGLAVVGAVPFAIDVIAAENQLSLSGIDSYVEFQNACSLNAECAVGAQRRGEHVGCEERLVGGVERSLRRVCTMVVVGNQGEGQFVGRFVDGIADGGGVAPGQVVDVPVTVVAAATLVDGQYLGIVLAQHLGTAFYLCRHLDDGRQRHLVGVGTGDAGGVVGGQCQEGAVLHMDAYDGVVFVTHQLLVAGLCRPGVALSVGDGKQFPGLCGTTVLGYYLHLRLLPYGEVHRHGAVTAVATLQVYGIVATLGIVFTGKTDAAAFADGVVVVDVVGGVDGQMQGDSAVAAF